MSDIIQIIIAVKSVVQPGSGTCIGVKVQHGLGRGMELTKQNF
jgi:hypothetical protein